MRIYEHLIDSKDYSNSTNFKVILDKAISINGFRIKNVVVPSIKYLITTTNQNIYFNEGTVDLIAVVPVGTYSTANLLAAVKTSLDGTTGATLTYTVTQDNVSNLVTISSTANFSLLFGTHLDNPSSCIGFNNNDLTGAKSYVSPNFPNSSDRYFLLCSDELSKGKTDLFKYRKTGVSNVLMQIPIIQTFGSLVMLCGSDYCPTVTYDNIRTISEIDIQLNDEDNNNLNAHGIPFSILFEFFLEK